MLWRPDSREKILAEIEPYLKLSSAQRWEQFHAACRGAARQLELRPDRAKVLAWRDPLPESTVRALTRLRAAARTNKT